ncbi:hypothetical protein BH10CHL1_BH10CHL1_36750 [soil metagenome]
MAVPNLWRTKKQRYSLQSETCSTCSQAVFPPREICPYCGHAMHGALPDKTQRDLYSFALNLLPAMLEAGQPCVVVSGDD